MGKDEITKEDIERYVKFGGERCPFCKSPEVIQDGVMFYDEEDVKVYKGMMCLTCLKDWTDVFSLTDVKLAMPPILKEE